MLCILSEPKHVPTSKKWREVLSRKEYKCFQEKATLIIDCAESNNMYCPEIQVKDARMHILYREDNKYVNFCIYKNMITYKIGTKNKENFDFEFETEVEMKQIYDYING